MISLPHLHIVGQKKSGKTSLIELLVTALTEKGYKVGTLKHSSHTHPLDKPGSDSHRFSTAGANPSVFMTPHGMASYYHPDSQQNSHRYVSRIFADCNLVLIESFRQAKGPKILVQKNDEDSSDLENIIAIINETGRHPKYLAFRSGDPELIDYIIQKILSDSE